MLAMPTDKVAEIHAAAPRFYENVGFDCGPGWVKLLIALGQFVEVVDPDARALQVKEKFGELRVYMGAVRYGLHDVTQAVLHASLQICEKCGEAGELRAKRGGWLHTFCDACEGER